MADNPVADEMRLYALEYMLAALFAGQIAGLPDPAHALRQFRSTLLEKARKTPFVKGANAGMSDLMSAELEEAFDRILRMQASLLGVDLSQDR